MCQGLAPYNSEAGTDREQLNLTQQAFQSAPITVWAETLLAAGLCLWGEHTCLP